MQFPYSKLKSAANYFRVKVKSSGVKEKKKDISKQS